MGVQGWNIKKFADFIYNSNPTVLEFISSPVTHYYKNEKIENLFEDLREHAVDNANPIGLYYHYISLSKRQYNKYIVEDWKVDKEQISKSNMKKDLNSRENNPKNQENNRDIKLSFGCVRNYSIEEAYEKRWVQKTTTERTVKRNLFTIRGICCAK